MFMFVSWRERTKSECALSNHGAKVELCSRKGCSNKANETVDVPIKTIKVDCAMVL